MAGVVGVGFVLETSTAFGWAFVYGLVYDLKQLHVIGRTSLMAVTVVLVIGLIRIQFEQRQGLSVLITSSVLSLLWQVFVNPPFDPSVMVLQVMLNILVWWILAKVKTGDGVYLRG